MTVKKLVVVIKDVASNEVLERWQFDVESDKSIMDDKWVALFRGKVGGGGDKGCGVQWSAGAVAVRRGKW